MALSETSAINVIYIMAGGLPFTGKIYRMEAFLCPVYKRNTRNRHAMAFLSALKSL